MVNNDFFEFYYPGYTFGGIVGKMVNGEQCDSINLKIATEMEFCPDCGSRAVKFGTTYCQEFKDIGILGNKIILGIDQQRYRCKNKDCGSVFMDTLPLMDENHRMTYRANEYIVRKALTDPFLHIANETGVDSKTVSNILKESLEILEMRYKPRLKFPIIMGMDEKHANGGYIYVITNIQEGYVYDVLPGRELETLRGYYSKIPLHVREQVKLVAIDMWKDYRTIIREFFPNAKIVIDKFHIVQYLNKAVDIVRKRVQAGISDTKERLTLKKVTRFDLLRREFRLTPESKERLEKVKNLHEDLKLVHDLKEECFSIFDKEWLSRTQALQLYQNWLVNIPPHLRDAFKPITTAINNWCDEIFNYFSYSYVYKDKETGVIIKKKLTNAYTEGKNKVAGDINRNGNGYSFEILRAKILFGQSYLRRAIEKFRHYRKDPEFLAMFGIILLEQNGAIMPNLLYNIRFLFKY